MDDDLRGLENKAESPGFRLLNSFRKERSVAVEMDKHGWSQDMFWRCVVGEIKNVQEVCMFQGFGVL